MRGVRLLPTGEHADAHVRRKSVVPDKEPFKQPGEQVKDRKPHMYLLRMSSAGVAIACGMRTVMRPKKNASGQG